MNMKTFKTCFFAFFTVILACTLSAPLAKAQLTDGVFPASGSPANPKVDATWNHYYNYQGISELTKQIVDAHPNLVKRQSIGKSFQGRDIWLLTVTNFNEGDPDRKPGMYIDGNIHSNEIQGTEMALYTVWYPVSYTH